MHHLHTQRESTGMHGNDKEKLRRCYYGNEIHRKIFLSTFYPIDNSIVKKLLRFSMFFCKGKKTSRKFILLFHTYCAGKKS